MKPEYLSPPHTDNHSGDERKVGFELEFSGLDLDTVASTLSRVYGGTVSKKSDFEVEVAVENTGTFTVEVDWRLGKKIAESRKSSSGEGEEKDTLMNYLSLLAAQVVPMEIVCPPVPITRLDLLDPMVEELRQQGAKGTEKSLVYAFGVHINPEIPDTSPWAIARYLQSFALAQEWLFEANNVDISRKISPYINPYPDTYIQRIAGYDSSVTLAALIDDYMEFNNSRNRALDMLPLWLHLDEDHMAAFELDDKLTQKRPTFHYRLPNCDIDKDNWFLNSSWNLWCLVENLAEDRDALTSLLNEWQAERRKLIPMRSTQWVKKIERYSKDLL